MTTTTTTTRAAGLTAAEATAEAVQRPFLCTFFFAGCKQNFATKNEWKRHVSTQHMQFHIWRCDYAVCDERKTATFNRKDLFGQHLKRMHLPPGAETTGPTKDHFLSTEVPKIQERCLIVRRQPPQGSSCGFCHGNGNGNGPRVFESWEERMEHVGRHYENAAASGEDVRPEKWVRDEELVRWSVAERLVVADNHGGFTLVSQGKEAVVGLQQ